MCVFARVFLNERTCFVLLVSVYLFICCFAWVAKAEGTKRASAVAGWYFCFVINAVYIAKDCIEKEVISLDRWCTEHPNTNTNKQKRRMCKCFDRLHWTCDRNLSKWHDLENAAYFLHAIVSCDRQIPTRLIDDRPHGKLPSSVMCIIPTYWTWIFSDFVMRGVQCGRHTHTHIALETKPMSRHWWLHGRADNHHLRVHTNV